MNLGGDAKVTNDTKERLTVRLPSELNKRLTEYLNPKGIPKNAFILGLINQELDKAKRMKVKEA